MHTFLKDYHDGVGFNLEMQGGFNSHESINVIDHINGLKDKNHKILLIDVEKVFDKIQHAFLMSVLQTVEQEGTQLNIIKALYEKPTVNAILNGVKVTASRKETGLPTLPTLPMLCSKDWLEP